MVATRAVLKGEKTFENSCVQSHTLVWHILVCGPRKQPNFVCFVERPLLWQGCAIMWQCTCRKERW